VTDTLPNLLTYIPGSLTTTNGIATVTGNTITWAGDVLSNTAASISFAGRIITSTLALGQIITNVAEIGWQGYVETDTESFETVDRLFQMDKQVQGTFSPSGQVTYTITLAPEGGAEDIPSVILTDTLPIELTYKPDSLTATNGVATSTANTINWFGDVLSVTPTVISFSALISPTAGGQITNTVTSIWEGILQTASASLNSIAHVYLPITSRNYCPDLFDTFGNAASSWPIGEDDLVRYGYLNGEYQVFSKSDQYLYLFRAPGCTRQNYTVEMDARWEGAPGSSYGLIFGLNGDFREYYLFDMNTDFQLFRLLRIDPGGVATIVPVTSSSAIYPGTTINHIKATRNGTAITLEVNGTFLGNWYDAVVTGLTYAGLMSAPYIGSPTSDARFDNFRITGLPSTAAAISVMSNPATSVNGSNVTVTHRSSPLADLAQWAEDSSPQTKGEER
jgi:uncharacterized repeat protein (TIGR01451 family)